MLSNDTEATTFAITDTELYVPVVTLSTLDNRNKLQQLKSGSKETINWNKYQSKITIQVPKPYLDFWVDPSFTGVNRIFGLSFENKNNRIVHIKFYLPTVEIKDYNVMIDGQNFFDQSVKNDWRPHENIRKIAISCKNCTTGCQLYYNYFDNCCNVIAIDLSKQHGLDADPKAIWQINFVGNRVVKIINVELLMIIQQWFSLLKKQKEQFYIFHKELL